jgi:hypothetical protein
MNDYILPQTITGYEDPCKILVQIREHYWIWRRRQMLWMDMLSIIGKLGVLDELDRVPYPPTFSQLMQDI